MFKIENWIVVLVLILALLLPVAVLAQEATPEPTPVIVESPPPDEVTEEPGDPPATTPENLLGQLFALLKDGTYMVWAAAGVLIFTGLFKIGARMLGFVIEGNAAILLALVIQVLIWIGYSIANYLGQGEAFKTNYLVLADIARSLLPLAGSIALGHFGYQAFKAQGTPVLGYKPRAKTNPTPKPLELKREGEGADWTKPAL